MNTLNYIGDYLGHFGFLAWVLLIGTLAGAIWKIKSTRGRVIAVAVILGLFAAFPGRWAWEVQQRVDQYKTAEAMFQERCKKSGEFIHRTVENVEGVFLMKVRTTAHMGDQWALDDQYGSDSTDEDYLKSFFLEPMLLATELAATEVKESIRRDYAGYHYVETIDPKDGKRYRYTGRIEEPWQTDKQYLKGYRRFILDKTAAPDLPPRYGVTYDDISTRDEREHWIASSSLKVIDLQTNEILAERIGYMMDPGQGANGGGRTPWLMAASYACPAFRPSGAQQPGFSYQAGQTRKFVTKVLKPNLEK